MLVSEVLHWDHVLGISGNVWVAGIYGGSPWAALGQPGNQWKQTTESQHLNRQGSFCHCCTNMFKEGQQQRLPWQQQGDTWEQQGDTWENRRRYKKRHMRRHSRRCVWRKGRRNGEGTCKCMLVGSWLEMHSWMEMLHYREGISEGSCPIEENTPETWMTLNRLWTIEESMPGCPKGIVAHRGNHTGMVVPHRGMVDHRGAHTGSCLPLSNHGPWKSPCWYKGNK